MANTPLIRDVLTVNQTVQQFYDTFEGEGPVFLLGRVVEHEPGFKLTLKDRALIIVADTYDGNGGSIDGSGHSKNPAAPVAGGRGADGENAKVRKVGATWVPAGSGRNGGSGGNGTSGSPGTDVTIFCRTGSAIRIDVAATASAPGGDGGNGGGGADGYIGHMDDSGQIVDAYNGTRGGWAGRGGAGGNGANGGTVTILSTAPLPAPQLTFGGTPGSVGGRGGRAGRDGNNSPDLPEGEEPKPARGSDGAHGTDGTNPQPEIVVLAESDYVQRMYALLDSDPVWNFNNFWAPFRINAGEYYFRRFQPADPDDTNGQLAAREFAAALEMQWNNTEASRLLRLLQSGSNALGIPRYQDVVPDFNRYSSAYNSITTLVSSFFNAGIAQIIAAVQLGALQNLLTAQKRVAEDAVATVTADLSYVQAEQEGAEAEVKYLQQQLDEANAEIQKSLESMKSESFSITGFIGTVAEVGAAIVSVVAAIPTAGASLVALVPAVIALSSTVLKDAPFILDAAVAGQKPDLDDIEKASKQVGKKVQEVVAAGQTVVNFVKLIEKISAGSTPANAESVALIKHGAELAHQLLVAKNKVDLNAQKIAATEARLGRTQGILDYIRSTPALDASSVRTAGQQAIAAALLQVDTLLTFAFLAQRSFEIYTLPSGTQPLPLLDAGSVHPDIVAAYQDGLPNTELAMVQAYQNAWNTLLNPLGIQRAYVDYLQRDIQTEVLRREFAVADFPELVEQLSTSRVLPFQVTLDSISQKRKETKIRGVAVAFVGASSTSSVISCELWHGTRYDQVGPASVKAAGYPNGIPVSSLLDAKSKNLQAPVTPLVLAPVHFGDDEPIDAPQQVPYWGRGVCGAWEVRLPEHQPGNETVDLANLQKVQVWIGYQYVPNP
ncbi:hypothetical protein Terro_1094 [Terriglobus roseus DSM 18391]|uniref:Uncharacterized protein n=1 Tax=Terriglobus roseus (strain DSM 18391 / NRRL B-41598 / KBS 63) TaxID=926566 RepID=I3ZDU6_TERRK|nr:hypothetical protein [Terriglobus roseus]AFL87414.1 hypothetical protein Terro_1094 [Terriglobus roseus DSM 18391]